jgi:hypothetical protein
MTVYNLIVADSDVTDVYTFTDKQTAQDAHDVYTALAAILPTWQPSLFLHECIVDDDMSRHYGALYTDMTA